ncbi:hypothetical protein R3P38DRAFT_2557530, partial [Favolaschia claudopus]
LNMSRQLATFARKMGDYERLVMAIAENDVPRVNALLSTALASTAIAHEPKKSPSSFCHTASDHGRRRRHGAYL